MLGEIREAKEVGRKDSCGYRRYILIACEGCGRERWVELKKGKPRSTLCRSCWQMGQAHRNWRGGIKHNAGRIYLYRPEHPFAQEKYVSRARLVLEEKLGRYLLPTEDSHHINGITDDDRPENLEEMSHSEHTRLHWYKYLLKRKGLVEIYSGVN